MAADARLVAETYFAPLGVRDFSELRPYARPVFPHLLDLWDGGPVRSPARSRRERT